MLTAVFQRPGHMEMIEVDTPECFTSNSPFWQERVPS